MAMFTLRTVKLNVNLLLKLNNCRVSPTKFEKSVSASRFVSNMPISNTKNRECSRNENEIIKSVYISQSNDIFTNLALENWMYKHFDFSKQHILLLWKNSPCVVIGRNQNPWLEANLNSLAENNIEIARRYSGGGTVYHDHGNLNLSFFTPKELYSRKRNLELISAALKREWKIESEINKREDMMVDGKYKISGTASRLGRPNTYHHCTLLVDVNQTHLKQVLNKDDKGIETTATRSTPAPVRNLSEIDSTVTVDRLINAVGWEYLRRTPLTLADGGWELVGKQNGFQLVNPTNDWFPGLDEMRAELENWDWRFGNTPRFSVTKTFAVPDEMKIAGEEELIVKVEVENGLVNEVILHIPASLMMCDGIVDDIQGMNSIRGRRFTEDAVEELNNVFAESTHFRDAGKDFLADCMRKVMASV